MIKPFSKKTTIVILIILSLLAISLSYCLLVLSRQGELNWDGFVNYKPKPIVYEELKTTIDTSDWLTYRNEKYGWEISYPKEWERVGSLDESVGFSLINRTNDHAPFFDVEINGDNPNNLTIDEIFKQKGWSVVGRNKITIDNGTILAFGDKLNKGEYREFAIIYFTKNGYVFNINWGDNLRHDDQAYEIFLNALATLKFYK